MTPEMADSIGYGTRIWLDKVWPTGTGSLVAPGWNCQTPFKLSQLLRTICGRGYSASGLLVSIKAAHRVVNGPCFICQAYPFATKVQTNAQAQIGFGTQTPSRGKFIRCQYRRSAA